MNLFLEVIMLCSVTRLVDASVSFQFEKMRNYGIGKHPIQNYRRVMKMIKNNGYEYPNPLPSTPVPAIAMIRSPYKRISQGVRRRKMDMRVYKKSFEYPSIDEGHKISCNSLLDCTISYISINTDEGIPTILRGGVGYRHFTIIVRAKPGASLKGDINVYCYKPVDEWEA